MAEADSPPPHGAPPAGGTPPPEARRRRPGLFLRSLLRSLLHTHVSVLLTVLLVAGAIAWLLTSTSGMYAVIALVNRFTPVTIEARGGFGSLVHEFGFAELRVTVDDTLVGATAVRARIRQIGIEPMRLDFTHVAAEKLSVEVTTDPSTPPVRDIGIPLQLAIAQVRLGNLTVAVDGKPFSLQAIAGSLTAGPEGYRVDEGRLALGAHTAQTRIELGAARPFPLQVTGKVSAQVQDKAVDATLRADGSLVELKVDGELSGAASGRFNAVLAAFADPTVQSLAIDLTGIDPRLWHPSAPQAELAIKAELAPNETMDRAAGSISVVNRAPGRIDAGRIPARSATAQVEVDARQLKFDRISAQLLQGSASGEFAIGFGNGDWQARARLADVDPAQLHGAMQALRIDGEASARHSAGTTRVSADLAHRGQPAAALAFDADLTPARATIHRARLELGDGYATAAGSVELAGAQRTSLAGTLSRFEPGRLVKGVDALLNGSLAVEGVLKPQPAGRLRFELADSRAFGRPLAGRGQVDIDAAQRVDVDIDLAVRSAHLAARGGLGSAERTLVVRLDAPAIAELLPPGRQPVGGALTLDLSARGDWTAPEIELRANAQRLRYGEHSAASLDVSASYGGGSDGALQLRAALGGYRYAPQPKATLQLASIAVEGRLSEHAIRVQATGDGTSAAILLADGGWGDDAWRGRIREAALGPPFDVRLLAPTALVAAVHGVEFGPAEFAVQGVRLVDVRLRSDGSGIATRGRFADLQPMRYAVPVEGALKPVLPASGDRVPLALHGEWDLRLARQVLDGRVLIERSGGDLYAGRGPESALGLIDARLDARIEANRLDAIVRIESERKGGLGAHVEAWLEDSKEAGWRLAQARPWLINGAFDLPTLDWINALLSDHLRANVRLGGRLASSVRIEGTPANPTASGRMTGSDLRVAWVEQGVRMENGTLLAHLKDDLIILEELKFSGPPRVRPDDRRAAAAMKEDEVGTVSANGQLRLRDFRGVIQVAASRLPLLQQPDRWVIASGGGNIETSATHVQVNGAFAAVAGFVGLARTELPTLSSDVVVVREGDAEAARARRVTLGFDLGIDLGDAFFLRGKGLSARVEGAVRLRSTGKGTITAVGSIAAVDGTYEGFGQRLRIARGRLNFQGPVENPGLDILALRTGLPVEVGVTITRTAADPLVRLFSDPPMADVEALSWLVLGRPPEQGGGDNIALLQAAASLLGGGEGYPTRVTKAIGIDEISIRSGTTGIASLLPQRGVAGALRSDRASAATVAGEVITIGKTINEALSLSYQQAITDTTRLLQANYRLSERLSAVAQGGTNNALFFIYTIAFD